MSVTVDTTVVAPVVAVLKATVEQANALAIQVKDANSSRDDKISSLLTTSEDAELAAWRAADAKAQEQIKAAQAKVDEMKAAAKARAESLITDDKTVDRDALKKDFLAKREVATSIRKTIVALLGGNEEAATAAIEAAGVVEIVNLSRGTAGATTGKTGTRKPRLASAFVDGKSLDQATFTNIAKVTGVDIDAVKTAANTAAGTDDLMGEKAGQEISFSVADKNGRSFAIVIVPKAPGQKDENVSSEEVAVETEK